MSRGDTPSRGKLRRAGKGLLWASFYGLVFLAALGASAILHLNLPAGRLAVARALSTLVSREIQGRIEVGMITKILPTGVWMRNVRVSDGEGFEVITVSELRARFRPLPLLGRLAFNDGTVTLIFEHVRVESAEVAIIENPVTGVPRLAEAFVPVQRPPEREAQPGTAVRVYLPSIEVGAARADLRLNGVPHLQGKVTRLHGSVVVDSTGAAIDVSRSGVWVREESGLAARGTASFQMKTPDRILTSFDGYVQQVQVGARFGMRGDHIAIVVDVPSASPAEARTLWEDWPLQVPLSIETELMGTLPKLQASIEAALENTGTVVARGPVDIDRMRADLTLETRNLAARAFHPDAPPLAVSAKGGISVKRTQDDWVLDTVLRTEPATLHGHQIPSIETVAHYEAGILQGKALVHEQGLPLRLSYRLQPRAPLHVVADIPWIRWTEVGRARAYLPWVDGRVRGTVTVDVDAERLRGTADLELRDVRSGDFALESGTVHLSAAGPPDAPRDWQLASHWTGTHLGWDRTRFTSGTLHTGGTTFAPRFELALDERGKARLRLRGTAALEEGIELRNVSLALERSGKRLAAELASVKATPGRVAVDGASLTQGQNGRMTARGSFTEQGISIDLVAKRLDLDETSEILGLAPGRLSGTVDADIAVTAFDADSQRLRASGRISDGRIGDYPSVSGSFDVSLQGSSLDGRLDAQVEGLGIVHGEWTTQLPGRLTSESAWSKLVGSGIFELNYVQLSALQPLLPRDAPIEQVRGEGYAQVRIERRAADHLPTLFFVGATRGLEFQLRTKSALTPPQAAAAQDVDQKLRIQGLDLQVGGGFDGTSARLQGSARLLDRGFPWISASGELDSSITLADVAAGDVNKALSTASLDVVVVAEPRSVSELQSLLPFELPGRKVSARAAIYGTIEAPVATGQLELEGLVMPGSRLATPLDLDLRATHDFTRGTLVAHGSAMVRGRRAAVLRARLEPATSGTHHSRHAEVHATLERLPLSVFAPLAEAEIGGEMSGTVTFQHSDDTPQLAANVQLQGLAADLLPLGDARLTLRADDQVLNGRVRFRKDRGSLEARVIAPLDWSELIPSVPLEREVTIAVDAEGYDAAILQPVLGDLFSELTGDMNADVSVTLHRTLAANEWRGSVQGSASLRNGVVHATAQGLDLRDVAFDASARTTQGLTAIDLRNVKAWARSEAANLEAEGILFLDGFEFVRATGAATLRDFPLVIEGVSRATATGGVNMQLESLPDRMSMVITVPYLNAVLPRRAGRSVLGLSRPKSIAVEQPLSAPTPPREADAAPWHIRLELGDRVRLSRSDLNIPFSGTPEIIVSDEVSMSGSLELEPGGRVELLGKVFLLETGAVDFDNEQPSNPSIDVIAVWRGPSHAVTVRLTGSVETPILTLTSDPPLPEPEVVALLLGGKPGEGGGSATATGVSVGGQLWDDLVADTPLGAVDIRATSEEERAKYTAAVRVSENVWFEASYKSRAENSHATPGASESEPGFSGTVDWRLSRDWSLRTDLGTLGAGFDLLWQYRY